ncbi:MAG: hypothetical protein JXA35_02510, partial [Deltaproteobacteria bacterium]|nr:hypothetical protein [Deltaproteobacteria bacterium]
VSERCKWSQADFNKKEVTDSIVGEYDICTCLSVMNWVRNKDNLIEFLSRQKKVIYEGHDNDQVERERLARAGFTDIEKIVSSERKRSVFIARKDIQTEKRITWENFEKRYGLKGVSFETPNVNTGDGNRVERIYFKNSEVWKVRLSAEKNPAKLASPYEEARFLQLLKDVPNICRFKSYLETTFFTVVILEYFPNIGTLDQVSIPPEYYNKVENQKHEVVKAVNERGILHNDILDRNFLVNSDYDICLIDFDQAQLISGLNDYEHGRYSRFSKPVVYHTAGDDKTGNLKKLEEAWDVAAKSNATSPGRYLAYYSLNADGRFLHGEIPWADRWKEIEKPLLEACNGDFNGKNIIELGCNMGLVSIWAAKNGAQCHGYDRYGDILEACKLNASAFGVSDRCKWDVIDFNNEAECKTISLDYDVCICLSLMKWVKQKPNLLGLLSRQKKLVYEGHDGNEVERDRLKGAGFSDIREIGISSRGRTIFLATRNTGSGLKYEKAEMLSKAWDIAARSNASYPGKYIAYYSLDVEGRRFPGERPWEERWKYIGKALREACGGDLNGKKILELGCNLGLLSVWAAREGAFCSGCEYEADILEGARLLASSFGVSERCKWSQADFNKKEVTDSIDGEYDICTCLSVMNWVRSKDNLIEFLSRQKKVIYEGHDSDQIETVRLRKAGFSEIERVAVSERGRGVFLARKTI